MVLLILQPNTYLRFGAMGFCCGSLLFGWGFLCVHLFGLVLLFKKKSSYQGNLKMKMKGRCVCYLKNILGQRVVGFLFTCVIMKIKIKM